METEIKTLHELIDQQLSAKDRAVSHFIVSAFGQLMTDIHTIAAVAEARARHESLPGFHM